MKVEAALCMILKVLAAKSTCLPKSVHLGQVRVKPSFRYDACWRGHVSVDMGGCQNYGPFLGTLNIRGRIIIGTKKGP